MRSDNREVEVAIEVVVEGPESNTTSREDQTMNSTNVKRPMMTRILAGTVFLGSLAFAAQVESQQGAATSGTRPQRDGEGRGGHGGDSARVERRVERLTTELALTTSQAVAVRQILLDEHTQMLALRPEGRGGHGGLGGRGRNGGDSTARGERRQRPDSAARAQGRQRPDSATMAQRRAEMEASREQMKALVTRTDARIAAVLSTEQRAAYGELVQKRPDRPEGGPGRGGRGGPGGRGGNKAAPPPAR